MEMDEDTIKEIAKQLRKPEGDFGSKVAKFMNESNAQMNLKSIELLNLQTNDYILEIGMGNGFFVKDIFSQNENIKYTGLDYSSQMVIESKKINHSFMEARKANFLHSRADNLPFKESNFDKIFTVNTIYFWKEPSIELSEIKRILKPNAEFIISIRSKKFMELFSFSKHNFILYSEKELTDLLEKNQFSIVNKTIIKEKVELNGEFYPMDFLIIKAKAIN